MREGTNVTIEGFDELQKKLKITLPDMIREMAFSTDASAAAFARKEENEGASRLTMGQEQQKPYTDEKGNAKKDEKYRPRQVYSKWDSSLGWVSTSKMTKRGPMAMGHFTWAEGTKHRMDSVISHYSNKVANLWARPTKPYAGKQGKGGSPLVGNPKHLTYWAKGESRPAKYNWSITAAIINMMGDEAVAKTEKKYAKRIKEL